MIPQDLFDASFADYCAETRNVDSRVLLETVVRHRLRKNMEKQNQKRQFTRLNGSTLDSNAGCTGACEVHEPQTL